MLLFIVAVAVTVIGAVSIVIGKCVNEHHRTYSTPDWFDTGSWVLFIMGIFFIVILAIIIACVQPAAQVKYEQCLYEKEVLEARLDQLDENPDAVGNELLYRDIIDFNNNLRNVKKWGSSKWVNWYNNMLIAENVDYIELPILTQGGD